MMGGPGRFGNLLDQETLKPRSLGNTLRRLGQYFGRFLPALVLAVIFVVVATWTQVTTPELTGQATDCFLVPLGAGQLRGSMSALAGPQAVNSASNCWVAASPSTLSGTHMSDLDR